MRRLLYAYNNPAFFLSHRLAVARAAREAGWEVTVAAPAVGESPARIAAEGFNFARLEFARGLTRPDRELRTLTTLAQTIRRAKPELVELATVRPILYGGLVTRRLGVPTVCWVTGLGHAFIRGGALARAVAVGYRWGWTGKRPLAVLFENRDDLAHLVRLGAVEPTVARVCPGAAVDLARFRPTPEPGGPFTVVYVGRMLREKGLEELVAAAAIARLERPDLRLVLAGEPDPANPSSVKRELLERWDARGEAEWIGRRDDVPSVLAASHVVCLPSWREGRPQALLEAAASGRPAVATDVPGCRDVVRDAETGILVPSNDPRAMAHALLRLANDPALRQRLGHSARRLAECEFGTREMVRAVLRTYEETRPRRSDSLG